MKRKTTVIGVMFALLLCLTFVLNPLKATGYSYGVEAGDTFTYELKKASANWDIDTPEYKDSGSMDSLKLDTVTLNEGDTFDLNIDGTGNDPIMGDYVEASVLGYTQTIYANFPIEMWAIYLWGGGASALASMEEIDMSWLLYSVITYADDQWWDDLETRLKDLATAAAAGTDEAPSFSFESNDEEFGVVSQYDVSDSESGMTYKVNTDFRMVWDKETGVMLGVLIDAFLSIDMTIQGMTIKAEIDTNFEITQEEYDIKGFEGGGMIPGFEFVFVFPVIGVIALIYRRRK